ncbi:MAG: phage minor head protein, partial [Pseudomonadota bacterium]
MTDLTAPRATIGLPPTETVAAFERRGDLRIGVDWRETWQDEHPRMFTVAKIARLDLLNDVRESLDKVLRDGGTFEQWKAELQPTLQRKGWWGRVENQALTGTPEPVIVNDRRLRTIYRTNVRVSRAAGQWQRIQTRKAVRPYLRYVVVGGEKGDGRNRPSHLRLHGIILPVDHAFWDEYYPPNDWLCRCSVQQLSERDLEREGWTVTTDAELAAKLPAERRTTYRLVNPTGTPGDSVPETVTQAPLVGDGWSYNPG